MGYLPACFLCCGADLYFPYAALYDAQRRIVPSHRKNKRGGGSLRSLIVKKSKTLLIPFFAVTWCYAVQLKIPGMGGNKNEI